VQALKAQPLTIYGDGSQTRSFCYVSDLVEGLLSMMEIDGFIGPVNLGNPDEHTILELAEIIIQLSKSSSKITSKPMPPDDPTRRCPEISEAKDKLDWKPKVCLEEGLMKTIQYFREKLGQK
jgi:UDP-glucuronate decarboxylase